MTEDLRSNPLNTHKSQTHGTKICNPGVPTRRWKVKKGNPLEAGEPSSLPYTLERQHQAPLSAKWELSPDLHICVVAHAHLHLHTNIYRRTCVHMHTSCHKKAAVAILALYEQHFKEERDHHKEGI